MSPCNGISSFEYSWSRYNWRLDIFQKSSQIHLPRKYNFDFWLQMDYLPEMDFDAPMSS